MNTANINLLSDALLQAIETIAKKEIDKLSSTLSGGTPGLKGDKGSFDDELYQKLDARITALEEELVDCAAGIDRILSIQENKQKVDALPAESEESI